MTQDAIMELKNISKKYVSVDALKNVSLKIYPGEICALIGSNGAGKSTMIGVMSGMIPPTSGTIIYNGSTVSFSSSAEARQMGISVCPQDILFFDKMTVWENLYLGSYLDKRLLKRRTIKAEAATLLHRLNVNLDVDKKGRDVSLAEKYIIQFARVLLGNPRVVIVDELTDSLTIVEANIIYGILNELKRRGVAIVYITHRIDEAVSVSDRIITMKDGMITGDMDADSAELETVKRGMLGDDIKDHYPKLNVKKGERLMRVRHISNRFLNDIDFDLYRGEILGIAGLVGSGRTSLMRAIVGLDQLSYGHVEVLGTRQSQRSFRPIIGYMPESRDTEGLFFNIPIAENITIRNLRKVQRRGVIRYKLEDIEYHDMVDRLGIDVPSDADHVGYLSGGNKQKVLVARNVFSNCGIYVFDEPTKGVDIAGKVEIYNILNELIRKGAGIVLVSSDFSELSGMCDRILVIKGGSITCEFSRDEADQQLLFNICGG